MFDKKHKTQGYTLIELMVIVALVGLLAAVAIPSIREFVRSSKFVDGYEKLKSLADGATAYYNTEHHYSSSGLVKTAHLYPGCQDENTTAAACENVHTCTEAVGDKINVDAATWNSQPWLRLGFQIGGPSYYCFYYTSTVGLDDTSFTAQAKGSLSEANDSEFSISGTSDGRLTPLLKVK